MRKFLHIVTDDERVIDPEGQDFSSLQDAIYEARQTARDLMAEELIAGRPLPLGWRVQVVDGRGIVDASIGFAEIALAPLLLGRRPEDLLFERRTWLRGQREAIEAALSEQPLETSLGILAQTATRHFGEGARVAFYLANSQAATLHHVVGMPSAYAEAVDGFRIGADSLACGLASHLRKPVLTTDVTKDPLWVPWVNMAEKFDYRGCWSFPIHTPVRDGTLAIYSKTPRQATVTDIEFASFVTNTAAILIDRHTQAKLRAEAELALSRQQG